MKSAVVTFMVGLTLLFQSKTVRCDCGEKLGKGLVMCLLNKENNINTFDAELCTHAVIGTKTFRCDDSSCWPNNSTEFEQTLKWVRPSIPKALGFQVDFDYRFIDQLSSRIKRLNTAKKLISFMEDRGLSFLLFTENSYQKEFPNYLNRTSLLFMEEVARAVHTRGWHIGLSLDVGVSNQLSASFDLIKLSRFVDWFRLFAIKFPDGKYLEPFLPLSSKVDPIGTAEYWIKHVLQWLKPECILLHTHVIGIKYTAKEVAVNPGPGSLAKEGSKEFLFVYDICETIELNTCDSFWDEDTSTPGAICGDDYYSYIDPRSMKLRTDLARKYGLAGMSIQLNNNLIGAQSCGHEDEFVLVRAVQGIRNLTESSPAAK